MFNCKTVSFQEIRLRQLVIISICLMYRKIQRKQFLKPLSKTPNLSYKIVSALLRGVKVCKSRSSFKYRYLFCTYDWVDSFVHSWWSFVNFFFFVLAKFNLIGPEDTDRSVRNSILFWTQKLILLVRLKENKKYIILKSYL